MRKFFLALSLLSIPVSTGAVRPAAQRHAGRAEGLRARRSALLPPGDGSGRFHHSGLPAGKSSQDQRGLRSGAEKPRPISAFAVAPTVAQGRCRASIRLRGGIGEKSQIALVLASYSPIWGSRSLRMRAALPARAQSPCPDECSQFSDDHRERTAIRQDPPRREFSGGVVDHPSAPPGADPRVLQFRPHRRRYRRSRDARRRTRSSGCSICSRPNCSARATPSPRRSICAARWRSVRCRRATRSMC